MKENMDACNNLFKASGIITGLPEFSHNLYGEGFYTFKVKIPRLSESYDILPITVSDRLVHIEDLKIDTKVLLSGQIRSYNNYVPEEDRNKLIITVFTKEIQILQEDEQLPILNEVNLNGFICKPPVYRTTPFGREICDLLIACNRSYKKSDYIPSIAWGRNAKYSKDLTVGTNIVIGGRLQSRTYQKKINDNESVEKVAYEISLTKIEAITTDENI